MALIPTACNGYIHVSLDPQASSRRTREYKANFPSGGGMPISRNRTLWPVTGGAVGVQPGWFPGHATAFFYINLGEGTIPQNYSLPMQPVFQIIGPSNVQYDGSFCLPQVPLPANLTAKVGDNATIQIVETAQHGAALYNVRDSLSPYFMGKSKLTTTQVRRYHLCRTLASSRSQRDELREQHRHRLRTRLQHR